MKKRTQLKSKVFRCSDIEYDADDVSGLPETLDIDVYYDDTDPEMDSETLNACIEDWLSDRITELTGFCHRGFQFREIKNENRASL